MKSKFFQFLLLFFIIFFTMQILGIGQPKEENKLKQDIELTLEKSTVDIGDTPILKITNNLPDQIELPDDCPKEPLDVFYYVNGEWLPASAEAVNVSCQKIILATGETKSISYGKWKNELFQNIGRYKLELPIMIENKEKVFATEFEITESGFFKNIWNKLFYKPIYNSLIFLLSTLPVKYNLALAIIILTLLIKLILLVPTNKAIRSQRELQKVQPYLEEVRKKYEGNQQKIAEETMKIWKEHKINPFGSCLPLLIQFPILIGLFYVVKDGLIIDENIHLLYSFLREKEIVIDPLFFGLMNLTETNLYVLPVIVGGLQFLQMKLSFAMAKNKQKEKSNTDQLSQMQAVNSVMTYILPVMIAIFTASMPSAVGFYWGISTLFAIIQQYVMNKKVG